MGETRLLLSVLIIGIILFSGCASEKDEKVTVSPQTGSIADYPKGVQTTPPEFNLPSVNRESNLKSPTITGTEQSPSSEVQSSERKPDCPNFNGLNPAFISAKEESMGNPPYPYDYSLNLHEQYTIDGWVLDYDGLYNSFHDAARLYCKKGSDVGENTKYYYCKYGYPSPLLWNSGTKNYMKKMIVDEDGVVEEIFEISPTIVYDLQDPQNFRYIETICENNDA